MNRKDFLAQVGLGAAALLVPACIGGLASCSKSSNNAPTNVDFTLDVGTGSLATNGGYLIHSGVLVARTTSGTFLAVSAACTHEGTNVNYNAGGNNFICPNHGAQFSNTGAVTKGPASKGLSQYKTTLTGTSLRVYS
ncbi:MAG: Rieske (2Fe-2S) protein [Phycisphaerales bacterium]|nr:Rieske (2Fe-2S) protein [Phycisphaerales bacterium]